MSSSVYTDVPVSHGAALAKTGGFIGRAGYCAVLAFAALAGALMTPAPLTAHAVAQAGQDWANLLRAMAGLKVLMALGAAGAVFWRLGSASSALWLVAYAAAGAGMMVGPGLIWGLWHVALGALFLHAGLAATVVLLWRDPVVGNRLAALLEARRRALRG